MGERQYLEEGRFETAMQKIRDAYEAIYKQYNDYFIPEMDALYNAWKSQRGYDNINKLYNDVGMNLGTLSAGVLGNYNQLSQGAKDYANSVGNRVPSVPFMVSRTYDIQKKKAQPDLIDVKEDEIESAEQNIKNVFKAISTRMEEMESYTSSDDVFGFWSTGNPNPRQAMNNVLKKVRERLQEAVAEWENSFRSAIDSDNQERDAKIAAASDLSDSF